MQFGYNITQMDDQEILDYLGLEIEDQSINFYDSDMNMHRLNFSEIKEITIERAYTPIEKKLSFWLSIFIVRRNLWGVPISNSNAKSYSDEYVLEIELNNGQVLSRNTKNIPLYKVEVFITEINSILNAQN